MHGGPFPLVRPPSPRPASVLPIKLPLNSIDLTRYGVAPVPHKLLVVSTPSPGDFQHKRDRWHPRAIHFVWFLILTLAGEVLTGNKENSAFSDILSRCSANTGRCARVVLCYGLRIMRKKAAMRARTMAPAAMIREKSFPGPVARRQRFPMADLRCTDTPARPGIPASLRRRCAQFPVCRVKQKLSPRAYSPSGSGRFKRMKPRWLARGRFHFWSRQFPPGRLGWGRATVRVCRRTARACPLRFLRSMKNGCRPVAGTKPANR